MKTLKHYNVNENITYRTLVELQKFKARKRNELQRALERSNYRASARFLWAFCDTLRHALNSHDARPVGAEALEELSWYCLRWRELFCSLCLWVLFKQCSKTVRYIQTTWNIFWKCFWTDPQRANGIWMSAEHFIVAHFIVSYIT